MPDQLMGKENPAIFRNHFHQIRLDLLRVRILRQSQPARKPLHVRINNHSRRNSESSSQHDVPSLSRDARKREDLLHRAWHFAAKLLDDLFASAQDRFRLVAVKAGRADFLLDVTRVRIRERGRSWILLEEPRRNHVHALVSTLRRQNGGDQKLERIVMFQCAARCWIRFVEPMQDGFHSPGIWAAAERASAR